MDTLEETLGKYNNAISLRVNCDISNVDPVKIENVFLNMLILPDDTLYSHGLHEQHCDHIHRHLHMVSKTPWKWKTIKGKITDKSLNHHFNEHLAKFNFKLTKNEKMTKSTIIEETDPTITPISDIKIFLGYPQKERKPLELTNIPEPLLSEITARAAGEWENINKGKNLKIKQEEKKKTEWEELNIYVKKGLKEKKPKLLIENFKDEDQYIAAVQEDMKSTSFTITPCVDIDEAKARMRTIYRLCIQFYSQPEFIKTFKTSSTLKTKAYSIALHNDAINAIQYAQLNPLF